MKKFEYAKIEEQLLEFISLNINAKNPITIWTIETYCDPLMPEKAQDLYNTKYIRINCFIKNGFALRTSARIGHLYPKNS